jgi:hypothetical protein
MQREVDLGGLLMRARISLTLTLQRVRARGPGESTISKCSRSSKGRLWVRLGHSAMSAQFPACPKADRAGRRALAQPPSEKVNKHRHRSLPGFSAIGPCPSPLPPRASWPCLWVLHLEPIGRAAGAIGRALALRDDAFEAHPAGCRKITSPGSVMCSAGG